jgi:hypothetical protein
MFRDEMSRSQERRTQAFRDRESNALQRIVIFGRVIFVVCYIGSFNTLFIASGECERRRGSRRSHTMSTKSRSSRIIASCTSKGNESRDSSLAFPFDFVVVVPETMRELSGARTNDSSEMNEGSWARFHQVEEAESGRVNAPLQRGSPGGETCPLTC